MLSRASQEHYMTSGHGVGGRAQFVPMKAARWCSEAKKARLPGCENIQTSQIVCAPQTSTARAG